MKKSIISLLACASLAFMFLACPTPAAGTAENPEVAANAEAAANLEAAANATALTNTVAAANATAAYDAANGAAALTNAVAAANAEAVANAEAALNAEAKANAIAAGTYTGGSSSGASTSVLRVVSDGTIIKTDRFQFKLTGTNIEVGDVWTFKFKITEEDKVTGATFRGIEGSEKFFNGAALSTFTALTGDYAGWYEVTCNAAKASSSFGFTFTCDEGNPISSDAVVYLADLAKNGTPVSFNSVTVANYSGIEPVATIVTLADVQ